MERKANHIQLIQLSYSDVSTLDAKINCPFNVKSVRFVSMSWTTNEDPAVTDTFYIASTIPGVPFVCFVDSITSNKSFEYIFSTPQQINGTYTFQSLNMLGKQFVWPGGAFRQDINIVLEFTQE